MWGADFDELIELHVVRQEPVKRRGRKKHDLFFQRVREATGQRVLAVRVSIESVKCPRVAYAGMDDLKCTSCGSKGHIVLDFNHGDACPKCKTGTLKCEGVEY